MSHNPADRALIVQGDQSLLLEVHHPAFEEARADIAPFTELEKSPEHIHTYRMTPLSLWNAASAGLDKDSVLEILNRHTRYPIPENVLWTVGDLLSRWGRLRLHATDTPDQLYLEVLEARLRKELGAQKRLAKFLTPWENGFLIGLLNRGTIKQELIELGYPVQDMAPLLDGDPLEIPLRQFLGNGEPFTIRDYQRESTSALLGNRQPGTGFGTIVLPCGAGKTVVGIKVMAELATNTLILTTNVAAVHQWMDELLDKTHLTPDQIGEYTGDKKDVKPVTIATYQVLVWRKDKDGEFPHFKLFRERNWGLIIYDEVHLLPAPVFRVAAEIQATRRVGLTATLVREDGAEASVFSLVGPKKYDVPWKQLEAKGWIAKAFCTEIRVDLPEEDRIPYAVATKKEKFRLASVNRFKNELCLQLVANHREDQILVIGQYLDQLESLSKALKAPMITGQTPNPQREVLYQQFREGKIKVLVVSKVANFAINLPDASVAIQVSGTFGSRQEEAQRLGRILRPKQKNCHFYTLVSRFTTEEEFAGNRQKFLTEQGYKYTIDLVTRDEMTAALPSS